MVGAWGPEFSSPCFTCRKPQNCRHLLGQFQESPLCRLQSCEVLHSKWKVLRDETRKC